VTRVATAERREHSRCRPTGEERTGSCQPAQAMIGLSTPDGIERVLAASATAIGPDLGRSSLRLHLLVITKVTALG
jgi:hypothetical protein